MSKNIICIEGNIGVGKTTLIELLQNNMNDTDFIFEPVELWKNIKGDDNENLLFKFYNDQERWAYSFQLLAYITYMKEIEDKLRTSKATNIVLDRSLDTNKYIFEKMLYNNKKISEIEHQMYNLWFNFYNDYVRKEFNNIVVYLRCDPEIALQRIKKRGRIEEQNIDLDYLNQIHQYHEEWLLNKDNVIIIDCNNEININDIILLIKKKLTKKSLFSYLFNL
jgi:deoxyadenosine/deoxycytidine kinase